MVTREEERGREELRGAVSGDVRMTSLPAFPINVDTHR
jgi:hypothetical protein